MIAHSTLKTTIFFCLSSRLGCSDPARRFPNGAGIRCPNMTAAEYQIEFCIWVRVLACRFIRFQNDESSHRRRIADMLLQYELPKRNVFIAIFMKAFGLC